MRRHTFAFVLACVLGMALLAGVSTPARADMDSAIDKAMGGIQIERLLGQLLTGINFNALFAAAERSATDMANGRTPEAGTSPALLEMQDSMQKEMARVAPQLMRGVASAVTPLLGELRGELQRELQGSLPGAAPLPEQQGSPNQ